MPLVRLIQILVVIPQVLLLGEQILLVSKEQAGRDGVHALPLPLAVVAGEVPVDRPKEEEGTAVDRQNAPCVVVESVGSEESIPPLR